MSNPNNNLLWPSKSIVSIKEARDLLGPSSVLLNDGQVMEIIDEFDFMAKVAIRAYKVRNDILKPTV